MNRYNRFSRSAQSYTATQALHETDSAGVSKFISQVYTWMFLGLLTTGFTSMMVIGNRAAMELVYSNMLLLIIAEFALVWGLAGAINKMTAQTASILFMVYSILNGLTLSTIFLVYTASSISSTFFVTAATFGVVSLYGYQTKKDLTSMGSFAIMGLIGIIIASVVNIFLASPIFTWMITYIGVLVFVGLTAYDTQKLKYMYGEMAGGEVKAKGAIIGALALYLDFINLFLMLLRIMGDER